MLPVKIFYQRNPLSGRSEQSAPSERPQAELALGTAEGSQLKICRRGMPARIVSTVRSCASPQHRNAAEHLGQRAGRYVVDNAAAEPAHLVKAGRGTLSSFEISQAATCDRVRATI